MRTPSPRSAACSEARVATPATPRERWDFGVERREDLKHEREHGDESLASILQGADPEAAFRRFIGGRPRGQHVGASRPERHEATTLRSDPDQAALASFAFSSSRRLCSSGSV